MAMLTVAQMASAFGVTRQAVHKWIAQTRPRIHPQTVGKVLWLSEADQHAIRTRPRNKIGRPRKSG